MKQKMIVAAVTLGAMLSLDKEPIKEGQKAPDFYCVNQDGNVVSLGQLLQKGPLILYFYPKANTPG